MLHILKICLRGYKPASKWIKIYVDYNISLLLPCPIQTLFVHFLSTPTKLQPLFPTGNCPKYPQTRWNAQLYPHLCSYSINTSNEITGLIVFISRLSILWGQKLGCSHLPSSISNVLPIHSRGAIKFFVVKWAVPILKAHLIQYSRQPSSTN